MRLGFAIVAVVFLTHVSIAQAKEVAQYTAQEANIFHSLKKLDKAIEKYDIALSEASDPRLVSTIYFNKGTVLYKMKEYSKAIDAFAKALATDKKRLEAKASYNLGNAKYRLCEYFLETDIDKAIELCRQALDYYKFSIESGTRLFNAVYNYEYVKKQLDYFLIKKNSEEKKKESQRYPRNNKAGEEGSQSKQKTQAQQDLNKERSKQQKDLNKQQENQDQKSQGARGKEQGRDQQQDKKDQEAQDNDRGRNARGSAESSANGQDDLNSDMQKQSKQLENEFDKKKERLKQENQGEDLKNKLDQLDKQKAQAQQDLNKERSKQQQDTKDQKLQGNDQGRNVRGSAESSATGQDSLNNESLQSDKIGDNKKSLDREDSIDYTKSEYGQEESKQVPEERLSREEANRLLDAYNRNEKGLLRDGKKAYPAKNYSYNDW